jgi:hypothetical protein
MRLPVSLACVLALSACAVPVAAPGTTEQVTVSATQWNLVAAEFAARLDPAIGVRRPVVLEVPTGTRSTLASGFGDMLATALVAHGHAVSYATGAQRPGPNVRWGASPANVRFDFRRVLKGKGIVRPLPEIEISAAVSLPGPTGRQDVARETRTFYVPNGDAALMQGPTVRRVVAARCHEILYAIPYSSEIVERCAR